VASQGDYFRGQNGAFSLQRDNPCTTVAWGHHRAW
jgi:hypothetical protein